MNIKLLRWLSSLAIIATSLTFTVPAAAYTFRDDPSSAWGRDPLTADHTNGNVYTVENLLVQNNHRDWRRDYNESRPHLTQ